MYNTTHKIKKQKIINMNEEDYENIKEPEFDEALKDIRDGKYTSRLQEFIEHVTRPLDESDGVKITYLASTRKKVDQINLYHLNQLPGKMYEIHSIEYNQNNNRISCCVVPEKLYLKIGAKVMLKQKFTLEYPHKVLLAGLLGVVIYIDLDAIYVQFEDNNFGHLVVRYPRKKVFQLTASQKQFPFTLAFALQIEQAQGRVFDKVCVDLDGCASNLQTYVALTSARSINGLQVLNFTPQCMFVC